MIMISGEWFIRRCSLSMSDVGYKSLKLPGMWAQLGKVVRCSCWKQWTEHGFVGPPCGWSTQSTSVRHCMRLSTGRLASQGMAHFRREISMIVRQRICYTAVSLSLSLAAVFPIAITNLLLVGNLHSSYHWLFLLNLCFLQLYSCFGYSLRFGSETTPIVQTSESWLFSLQLPILEIHNLCKHHMDDASGFEV